MKAIANLSILALAVSTLLVGCATGPQHDRAWEYKTVTGHLFGTTNSLTDAINREVSQGWQFVSSGGATDQFGFAVLKREKK